MPIKSKPRTRSRSKPRRWTPEQRKAQAQRMRQTRAWAHSTGPRTQAGKARVARNAWKHGGRDSTRNALLAMLRRQRYFVRGIMAACAAQGAVLRQARALKRSAEIQHKKKARHMPGSVLKLPMHN